MNLDTHLHAYVFAISFFIGMAMGVVYDVMRAIRLSIKHNDTIVCIEDIIYFSIYGYIIFNFFVKINNGMFIIFPFVAFFLGELTYFLSITKIVLYLFQLVIQGIIRLINIIYRPISYILCKIYHFFFKYLLKPLCKILYNIKHKLYTKCKLNHNKDKTNINKRKNKNRTKGKGDTLEVQKNKKNKA